MVCSSQIASTINWIDTRLDFFDCLPGGTLDYAKLKAFGELSIVQLYLSEKLPFLPEAVASSAAPFLNRCTTFIRLNCDKPVYIEAARKDPIQGYGYILPYLLQRRLGFRSASQEELIRWLGTFGLPLSVEAIPYRMWDRNHALWRSGLRKTPPSCFSHYQDTSLALRRGTLHVDRDEAYAATHIVFYMTDFGLQAADVSDTERKRIGMVLRSLLIHYLRKENWDLACELLMCLYQLRWTEDALMRSAAATFKQVHREDGSMPAHGRRFPVAGRRRQHRQNKRSPEESFTLGCYHPTFVWLLYALSTFGSEPNA